MHARSDNTSFGLTYNQKSRPFTYSRIVLFFISLIFCLPLQAQLAPVQLGRASNVYTILREAQNQVYANDAIDLVAFIHRQDSTIWGGANDASGIFRYDLSINGGKTFNVDVGPLNTTNKFAGRYPHMVGLNPRGISGPLDEKFIYLGPPQTAAGMDWYPERGKYPQCLQ